MNYSNPWLQTPQEFQQAAFEQWNRMLQSSQAAAAPLFGSAMPQFKGMPHLPTSANLSELFKDIAGQAELPVKLDAAKWAQIQQDYLKEVAQLWNQGLEIKPPQDMRFSGEAWSRNPMAAFSAAMYLLNARTLMKMAEAVDADAKTQSRVNFAVQQWIDASAPSNFLAFNADAQQKAIDTRGESISRGVQNLLHDMRLGRISQTDESAFEVGVNVATTEGSVVYENELFQLIEYKPLTAKVSERPFLLVPPSINKFYILDLQPANSFIRYCVEQGQRTFVVSWRNPDQSLAHKTWDDYIDDGVIRAISLTREITGAETINALGFCIGGTMLGTSLAVLAARGEKPVNSATFLTSMLDFKDTGILDIFIDESFVKMRELQFAAGGLLPGRELATTFSFLRPNDLVWNYVVGNYLKGEKPQPFDLLYWNGDSTNLPGPYYAWYLRNTYLENRLVQPGAATVCGEKVDLSRVDIPVYLYGSKEDHIVPIGGAYASTQHLPGPKRFVMGASGHIAGVINPASKNKRSHWIGSDTDFPADVNDWIANSTEHKGSWWTDWAHWLKAQGGAEIAAPKTPGNRKYKAIEPAPGRYVKAKA